MTPPIYERLKEPRWPAFVAMLATSGLYLALPEPLSLGPAWALPTVVAVLLVPILVLDYYRRYHTARILTVIANSLITLAMIGSLALLVKGIPTHLETPKGLLRSACALWVTNILVFALWYWKLDAGGPLKRAHPDGIARSSFLFPQMLSREGEKQAHWQPH